MLNSELTATTLGVDQEDDNVYDSLPISGTCQDVVTVHSMLDEEIDRASYDADLYDGHNDGAYMHLTNDQEQPSTINSLSTNEIQQIIEDIINRETTVKSFSKVELNEHVIMMNRKCRVDKDISRFCFHFLLIKSICIINYTLVTCSRGVLGLWPVTRS